MIGDPMPFPVPDHRSDEAGFTLIEMLVVLTIIGLLAAVALSNLSMRPAFVDRAKLRTGLTAAIAAARQEASLSGKPIVVDIARLAIAHIGYTPSLGSELDPPIVFPDGSTNGGTITVAGRPAVSIGWMTGQVSDASH